MTSPRSIIALLTILSFYSGAEAGSETSDLYLIDAHSQVDSEEVLQRVITLMDQAGVRRSILSSRGKLKSGDIAKFAEQHAGRITASVRTKGRAYEKNTKGFYKALERMT